MEQEALYSLAAWTGQRAARGLRWSRALLERHLLFLPVLITAVWLRLTNLDATSLWFDELWQAAVAQRPLDAVLAGARAHTAMTPLDYLLGWVVHHFAATDFAVRLPAALFGSATLVLLYWLGCLLFGRRTAWLGSLLLAGAPLHLFYSREARPYAILTFMTLAVMLAFYYLWRTPTRRTMLVYALVVTLGLYSHYFVGLPAAVQWLVALPAGLIGLLRRSDPTRAHDRALAGRLTVALVAAGLLFLPWVVYDLVLGGGEAQFGVLGIFGAGSLVGALDTTVTAFGQVLVDPALTRLPLLLLWLIGSAVALLRGPAPVRAVALLLPLTVPLVWGLDAATAYFFAVRQVVYGVPVYLLLVAYGVAVLWRAGRRALTAVVAQGSLHGGAWARPVGRLAGAALLGAILLAPVAQARNAVKTNPGDWQRHWQEESWRQAADYISGYLAPGDVVLTTQTCSGVGFAFNCLDYYHPGLARITRAVGSLDELKTQYAASEGNTWILLAQNYNRTFFKGNTELIPWIQQQGLQLDTLSLLSLAYPAGRLRLRPPQGLPAAAFQTLFGTSSAGGGILRLTRRRPDAAPSVAVSRLLLAPGRRYQITFDYRAPEANTGLLTASVDAPDAVIPGRLFKYTSPDLPATWRNAILTYTAAADPQTSDAAYLVMRYDGLGAVAVRNILVYDISPRDAGTQDVRLIRPLLTPAVVEP